MRDNPGMATPDFLRVEIREEVRNPIVLNLIVLANRLDLATAHSVFDYLVEARLQRATRIPEIALQMVVHLPVTIFIESDMFVACIRLFRATLLLQQPCKTRR